MYFLKEAFRSATMDEYMQIVGRTAQILPLREQARQLDLNDR